MAVTANYKDIILQGAAVRVPNSIASEPIEWGDVLDGSGTKPTDNATVGADWNNNLVNIPAGIVETYYQSIQPVGAIGGDYWIDSDTNETYRYSGTAWVSVQDDDISFALLDAADAQATADGKIFTFVQAIIPTADGVGDLWMDTDDNNKMYRWSGSSWIAYAQDSADWGKVFGVDRPANNADVTGDNTAQNVVGQGALAVRNTVGEIQIDNNSVLPSKMSVMTLSSIVSDLGVVNAGSITGTAGIDITGNAIFRGEYAAAGYDWAIYVLPPADKNGIGIAATGAGDALHANCFSGYAGTFNSDSGTGLYTTSNTGFALSCDGYMVKTGTEIVANLNADLLDGKHANDFIDRIGVQSGTSVYPGVTSYIGLKFGSGMSAYETFNAGANEVEFRTVGSDRRLKYEIEPEVLGLDFIKKLNPVTYKYINGQKSEITGRHLKMHGLIAQDVQAILNILPSEDSMLEIRADDGMLSLDYTSFIAPLIKAMQELSTRIESLENA